MPTIFKHPNDLLAAVGQDLGASEWMTMEQDRVNMFADATEDHQWIHVDPERSANGPFGACIAHGYLTLSLASKFLPEILEVQQVTMGVNYGCEKVRFVNAVKVGSKIRGTGTILSAEEKPSGVHLVVRLSIEIEGEDKPACVADTISRFYYG
jgi:acyl dehydratase